MRISIIISVFNCWDLTKKCLETLEKTLPEDLDHELILIDDGSSDGSRDFLKEFGKQREHCNVIANEKNLGFARSNNRGVEFSSGSYLLFLNNDTELTDGWIEPMINGFEKLKSKNPGMIGNIQRRPSDEKIDHAGVYVNREGKPDHLQIDPAIEFPRKRYSERLATTGACFMIPRELYLKVGGFGTEFQNGGEDMDLNFKVRKTGHRIFVANKSCIWHHVSASPGRNDHHERNTRKVFQKWREFLLEEGAKQWTRDYLIADDTPKNYFTNSLYRRGLAFEKGWSSRIPQEAIDAVDSKIKEQETIWEQMFGSESMES